MLYSAQDDDFIGRCVDKDNGSSGASLDMHSSNIKISNSRARA